MWIDIMTFLETENPKAFFIHFTEVVYRYTNRNTALKTTKNSHGEVLILKQTNKRTNKQKSWKGKWDKQAKAETTASLEHLRFKLLIVILSFSEHEVEENWHTFYFPSVTYTFSFSHKVYACVACKQHQQCDSDVQPAVTIQSKRVGTDNNSPNIWALDDMTAVKFGS